MRLLRIGLLALVALPFAAVAGGTVAVAQGGCTAPVRGVPFSLPAPLTIRTSCGRFRIARAGVVSRLPHSPPLPRPADTFWESGVWSGSPDGHLMVGRAQRTLWRSRGRFPRDYEVEVIALGGNALAFSYGWRNPELFVARFGGAERRVARRELPLGWTRAGLYTRRGETLLLRSPTGALRATIARDVTHAAYDASHHIVRFVVRGRLFHTHGRRVRALAKLGPLGLATGRTLELHPLGRLLVLEDALRLVALRPDGTTFASTYLPRGHHTLVSAWPTAAPDGTGVAFAAMRPDHRVETQVTERGVETVYLLRPGARTAVAMHTQHMSFNVCGHATSLAWHGSSVACPASAAATPDRSASPGAKNPLL